MAGKNPGKIFEEDFRLSIPSNHIIHRLRDSAQSYNNSKNTSFAWDNECDFFVFDTDNRVFYAIECKTTKYKSMSVQMTEDDSKSSMIKHHQIKSLSNFAKYDYVVPCFILNFRDEETNMQRTYFMHIESFNKFMSSTSKKSINECDIILNGGIKIGGNKKRTRYTWDVEHLLNQIAVYKSLK